MSFDQLLQQAENEPHYEKMNQALTYIVQTTPDPYYLARFLEPFIAHVKSDNLNVFYSALQNADNMRYALPSMIHNVVNECRTNENLMKLIDLFIRKHL
jgi:hypothetical protein